LTHSERADGKNFIQIEAIRQFQVADATNDVALASADLIGLFQLLNIF
jgi:hypothetical protein